MIKYKITPELKKKIKGAIKETVRTGKEHGFLLCRDNKGSISATKSSEGKNDFIDLSEHRDSCPFKIQGDFHTHAYASDMKNFIKKEFPEKKVTEDKIRDITINMYEMGGSSVTGPSHGDLLNTLLLKRDKEIIGTVCTGSDVDNNKIECWTVKNDINNDHYRRAEKEITNTKFVRDPPHEWAKRLFHKEEIDLNKI